MQGVDICVRGRRASAALAGAHGRPDTQGGEQAPTRQAEDGEDCPTPEGRVRADVRDIHDDQGKDGQGAAQ
eukprot:15431720-Alexandrium_andersonii.AAC.1